MTSPPEEPGPDTRPPFDITQSNVGLSNTYRLELTKQVIAIAAGLFAFTVTFYGTAAPGPAPFASMGLGVIGIWVRRRKR